MRLATALLLSALLLPAARAQTPGDCTYGTAQADLDVSDVRATLFNTGSLFYGNSTEAGYTVPKSSGNSALYAANLWVGGTVGGEVRTAAATFSDFELWPGPLNDGATLPNPDDCSAYDRIYSLTPLDVSAYEQTGVATPDLAEWPVGLGAPAVDASGQPIETDDRTRVLDLGAGERPVLSGSQTAFWVMNDVGNDHVRSGSNPLGIEVAVTAFAIASQEAALDQATVYRYAVTNRNSLPIEDAYVSLWVDTDLGDTRDEYQGVDLERSMAFTCNDANEDSRYGVPPAVGYDFLSTELGAHRYMVNSSGGPLTDPVLSQEFYHTQQGLWNDGTPQTAFGNGYQQGGEVTRFAFPADPVAGAFWSELNADGQGLQLNQGNKRSVPSTPALTLAPGETYTLDFAIVFGQGSDHLDSITELRAASDVVQAAYDDGSLFEATPLVIALDTPELIAPYDGATFINKPAILEWEPVNGATRYVAEVQVEIDGKTTSGTIHTANTSAEGPGAPLDALATVRWRVRAEGFTPDGTPAISLLSDEWHYVAYQGPGGCGVPLEDCDGQPDVAGDGGGIIETAYADDLSRCPDPTNPDDYGCLNGGLGNTVWLDDNGTSNYRVVTDTDGGISRLRRYIASGAPFDFEMRFTDAGGWGLEFGTTPNGAPIWRVPFELWNLGTTSGDPSDDIRMIPYLISEEGESSYVWADHFPRVDPADDTTPATARVYWMMPDRPGGYALFETAAIASGGAGQPFVDSDQTDTPIDSTAFAVGDLDPTTGEVCPNTGGYVSYCYRNTETSAVPGANAAGSTFVYPIGRFVLADLAGDGTTPPSGTVIRVQTTRVDTYSTSEEAEPAVAAALTVAPNPSRGTAHVAFALAAPTQARVRVVDVLGRTVAVLADGALAAGPHRLVLADAALSAGVYVVVLEAGGERLTRTVTVVR